MNFCREPSWLKLAENLGCAGIPCRPLVLAPSYQDCLDNGIRDLHRVMGASCLLFFIPSFVYLWNVGYAATIGVQVLGIGIAVFLVYISCVSFCADYWYTGDTRNTNSIHECQKQMVFNIIDTSFNVPFMGAFCISLGVLMMWCTPGMAWWFWPLFSTFLLGVFLQQISLTYLTEFTEIAYNRPGVLNNSYDPRNPPLRATEALKIGLWLHVLWHVFATIPPTVQMYLLINGGLDLTLVS